jgi:hypothetical protein
LTDFKNNKQPHKCKKIEEARNEIDVSDFDIIRLFGLLFRYAKNVVKFNEMTPESIIATGRMKIVIDKWRNGLLKMI